MNKLKDIIYRIITFFISIFYITTNGVATALSIYGLINFIPKIIKYYNTSDDSKLVFYVIITIIVSILLCKFIKYLLIAIKTLLATIRPSLFN